MRKTRCYLLVTLLITVVGFASWLILSSPSEPVYQGKPLSYWCDQYTEHYGLNSYTESQKEAKIAIQTIGTNAIPTFLRMLQAKDSNLKLKFIQLVSKQHVLGIKWKPAQVRHDQAILGFICLGSSAVSAVPQLMDIYKERCSHPYFDPYNGDGVAIRYIIALIGPAAADAVPRLVEDTTDTNSDVRFAALWALGNIHAKPRFTVPALIRSLGDPISLNRDSATIDLGGFGSDAKSAIPDLIKALSDPSPAVRANAMSALKKIDPETAAKAGVK